MPRDDMEFDDNNVQVASHHAGNLSSKSSHEATFEVGIQVSEYFTLQDNANYITDLAKVHFI